MLLQEISDIEGFLKSLKSDLKVQITSNVNFLVINYLSQQKNLDPYSFIDKFASILSTENNKKLDNEIDSILSSYLIQSNDKTIDQKLDSLDEKLRADISKAIREEVSADDSLSSENNLIEKMKGQAANLLNKINEHKEEVIEINEHKSQKTKLEEYETLGFDFPSVVEGLKYIKAELTEKTREELLKFGFDPKIYSALRTFYHEESLYSLYKAHFPNISMIDFVRNKILSLEKNEYLTFVKKEDFPSDKVFRLKMGEFLLTMGKVTKEKLDVAVDIQNKESSETKTNVLYDLAEVENAPKKRLLGDIIVDLNYITKDELESTIEIQKWYNNLFS